MNKKHFYAVVILVVFLTIGIQPAHAVISIPSDKSVGTWDGSTYTLTTDVSGGLWIEQDGLTLDGAGHSITENASAPSGVGVDLNGRTGVTIQNLTVTGFQSSTAEFRLGIALTNSTDIILRNNTLLSNNYGIRLVNSDYNIVENNTLSNNTEYAIRIEFYSTENTLTNNTVSDNYRGIRILDGSNDNDIYNNNVINNTLQASVTDSTGNVFNLAAPIGGNYWDDWSGSDPYVFNGGQDDSPWTVPNGWLLPVPDTTSPEITCPGDVTIEAMGPDGVPVDDERIKTFLASASASDNCDPPEDIIITNNAPTLFPPGDTIVTFTATDTSIPGNSSTCQSTVTVVEADERHLRIIPKIINREGRLRKVLAVIRFPEGIAEEDINISQPLMLFPGDNLDGIEAISQRVVTWCRWGTLRVSVFASFSKDDVTAGVPEDGPAEMMVIGRLVSGQYFYGIDTARIISWNWRRW